MTTTLICNIISFVCCVVMFVINRKLAKRLKEREAYWRRRCASLSDANEQLLGVMTEDNNLSYTIFKLEDKPGAHSVFKTTKYNGLPYYINVKTFNDEDAEYNRRCAEELVEMLNS